MEKRIEDLRDLVKTQCSDGNWNHDPYMHGMANGMLLALSTITGSQCSFLEAPEVWLKDVPRTGKPITEKEVK